MSSSAAEPRPSSSAIRDNLCDALGLDLVGPGPDSPHVREVLPTEPSRWYLTGFLAPKRAEAESVEDADQNDEIESAEGGGVDDDAEPERTPPQKARFPASIGMSVLCTGKTKALDLVVRFGDYSLKEPGGDRHWVRHPHETSLTIALPAATEAPVNHPVPNTSGLLAVLSVRPVGPEQNEGDAGRRVASVFLVNDRDPRPDAERDAAFVFQVELEVRCAEPFVQRPDLRSVHSDEPDERVADLQYRDAFELAVGHGIATKAEMDGSECRCVRTVWLPQAAVERVEAAKIEGVELGMEALAALPDAAAAALRLSPLVDQYRQWIEAQRQTPLDHGERREVAEELMRRAGEAAGRIAAGIDLLRDEKVLTAFRLANKVMAKAARQRRTHTAAAGDTIEAPEWRPFQLAFLLLNLRSIVDPRHHEREVVDLLFFPTGGGKTEAYLGLAAFTLVLRRLQHPGIAAAGVTVLMRYTLRLLTLDQLSRASTLICALELERRENVELLGEWPFEIGLWVGRAATPNRMGGKGDKDPHCAYRKHQQHQSSERKAAPVPLENCPWCNTKFDQRSFRLVGSAAEPVDLAIHCSNRECAFPPNQTALPIIAVDEPIYRRLPCFLIATVDKFAAMPWTGDVGAFFGRVDHYEPDGHHRTGGFHGPCSPDRGRPIPGGRLLPPDLIIQDELHLISGPMGTIAGLYETALDWLASREVDGHVVRPKVIASTATVRRAEQQIRALFARKETAVFPPPGPDRRDSFFARTDQSPEVARRYVGVAATGRSLKVILLRTYLSLLSASQRQYELAGGARNKANPADPYMTLLGYFNSLRELGGSRRIVEDEVRARLEHRATHLRVGEEKGAFANREIAAEPVELTSRVSTDEVAEAKQRLAQAFPEPGRVDVALATNMISVGLDITRLGLMVVLGQPKTSAEYIQATSRVGRQRDKPGLVVTLLNTHRPRDRSHYERFACWHASFYRSVEATSVTPFSPRALDRALAGTVVALARHGNLQMTPPRGAGSILEEAGRLRFVVDALVARAAEHLDPDVDAEERTRLVQRVRQRTQELLDAWNTIANDCRQLPSMLEYQKEYGGGSRLLYEPLHAEAKTLPSLRRLFIANRSMRDVEPQIDLVVKRLDGIEIDDRDGGAL